MSAQYKVELIAIDREDPTKDVSLKKTVRASNEEVALRRAKTLAKAQNPELVKTKAGLPQSRPSQFGKN